ncbi:MAG: Mut7-C RNAse domain-containing protein [Thaumarchaeota archaeon]|nr:Mut7-C RNAse domain-containing protein [Nitrososphaerota archaeon]
MKKNQKQKPNPKEEHSNTATEPSLKAAPPTDLKVNKKNRFIADSMLGSLARKLRILGFDVIYFPEVDDRHLHDLSLREKRILLTADRALHNYSSGRRVSSIFLLEDSDEKRLIRLFNTLGLREVTLNPKESRCPKCNGEIKTCTKKTLSGIIPQSIVQQHTQFYRCASCMKVYWKGSHWRRIASMTRRVEARLKKGG